MTARSPGVPAIDKRTTVSSPDPATKSCLPSGEAATPLSAEIVVASGTSSHPVFGRQISMPPSGRPAISLSTAFGSLVLIKLLAAKASPGNAATPLPKTPAGYTTQPTQVRVGATGPAFSLKTSTDSRSP